SIREGKELLQRTFETYQRATKKKPDADAEIDCLIVLDEVMAAMQVGILDEADVMDFLNRVGEETEVILTGRNPSEAIFSKADYVSEVVAKKHPFDRGIVARTGVEK
ncbi:MAG: cob(I)yrinic acid a,c-diamide adenosyltransferase, partial [Lachnospiraceae bacterium]|nr:cob(I)yrinic acid a,c-diamide adenosyltransferase [Lachnospiraceae bacterium]